MVRQQDCGAPASVPSLHRQAAGAQGYGAHVLSSGQPSSLLKHSTTYMHATVL